MDSSETKSEDLLSTPGIDCLELPIPCIPYIPSAPTPTAWTVSCALCNNNKLVLHCYHCNRNFCGVHLIDALRTRTTLSKADGMAHAEFCDLCKKRSVTPSRPGTPVP